MKRLVLGALVLVQCSLLFAVDYGGLVKGEFEAAGLDETDTTGNIILAPWLSLPFDKAELSLSAGLNMNFADEQYFAPELFRLEYSHTLSDLFSFKVGRFTWQDPSHVIAQGRFDGAEVFFSFGKIRLGASVLYTGFLFKDTADINVSPTDTTDYAAALDWSDFGNTYFAPRRLMAAVYGEFPGFPSGMGHLYAGLMAQFDLSNADERFHTQYLLVRHTLVIKDFDIAIAGVMELEHTEADGLRPAFAVTLEGGWQVPGMLSDRLSLGFSWASGDGTSTAAFFPIVREARSYVLESVFSGIMIINAAYKVRLLSSLSAEVGGSYFIRTDATSFTAPYLEDDSYPLGLELDTSVVWVPFSDLSVSAKGGVFLPRTGTAWAADAPVFWRITLGAFFSF